MEIRVNLSYALVSWVSIKDNIAIVSIKPFFIMALTERKKSIFSRTEMLKCMKKLS